jgi:hypothetical protein
MKEFETHKLMAEIRSLIGCSFFLEQMKAEKISSRNTGMIESTRKHVLALSERCKSADLPMSVFAVNRLLGLFELSENAVADSLVDGVKRTIITVEDELSLRSYFALEQKEADL